MTLRRAVRLFVRAWTPHPAATFDEWLLAAAVIEAAILKDEEARNGTSGALRTGAVSELDPVGERPQS